MMAYLAGLLIWLLVSRSVLFVLKLCSVCAAGLDDGLSSWTPYLASGELFSVICFKTVFRLCCWP